MLIALCEKQTDSKNSSETGANLPRLHELVVLRYQYLAQGLWSSDQKTFIVEDRPIVDQAVVRDSSRPIPQWHAGRLAHDSFSLAMEERAALIEGQYQKVPLDIW